jgi:hypothetical protein
MGYLGELGFVVRFLFLQQLIFDPQSLYLVFQLLVLNLQLS